jgi:hypothetical protein
MLTIHSNGTHTSTATLSQQYKTEKIRRPTLLTGGSSEEWSYFLTRWQDYAGAQLHHDIQLDLLGDKNQNMTLEEVFQFIEAKDAGKRSAGRLLEAQTANAARSQYRRTKQEEMKNPQPDNGDKCHYCGQYGHGNRAPPTIRKTACPAFEKTCGHCGRPNHLAAVCQKKEKPKRPPKVTQPNPSVDAEGAIFDSLCTTSNITAATNKTPIALDYHLYNHLNDCWVRQASKLHKPQPFVSITATICPEDYKTFELAPPTTRCKAVDIPAIADAGCQSCLASLKIIQPPRSV